MLQNNNLKICRKLAVRDFRSHGARSLLLVFAIALVCALCTFTFSMGGMVRDGFLYRYELTYGSSSHILFYGLTEAQAEALAGHSKVRQAVSLSTIGALSGEMMEYRSVQLAEASEAWAETTGALPAQGRMPQELGEIALDEITMDSLAIPHRLGAEVTLQWTASDGTEREDVFRLCGWWNGAMSLTETCAWITPETARALCPSTLAAVGVTLYRPGDLAGQAGELLADLGLEGVEFTTNFAYNDAQVDYAGSYARPFYRINIAVVLCGILMIYSIVRISTEQSTRFYGQVKSLGMAPRQLRRLLLEQAALLCLPAIPAGWLLGFGLHVLAAPLVVIGMDGQNPALFFVQVWPFAASGLAAFLTTLTACALPARSVAKLSPAQALRRAGRISRQPRPPEKRRTASAARMALAGLRREWARFTLTAATLLVALILLCGIWTQYVSYDGEKYVSGMDVCDYLIADASAQPYQRYNPHSRSITPELLEALRTHPAVTDMGVLRTMELPLQAGGEDRARLVETFETPDESGMTLWESMSRDADWADGYQRFRETGEYTAIAAGVDGLALECLTSPSAFNAGDFDPERFASGRYVIAAGAAAVGPVTTPMPGQSVTIAGRPFEIMASVPAPSAMMTGSNSRAAGYHIGYYMPEEVFAQLFPDCGCRNVLVDIDHSRQEEFEAFLTPLLAETRAAVTLRSEYQWNFENARFHMNIIPLLVGGMLLLIGVLNFVNALVTNMLVRRKEFAVYESLGMTPTQLRTLLLWEGGLWMGFLALLLVPVTAAATWGWSRWWLAHTNTWCITYRMSLAPLWIALPFLLCLAAGVPLACLRFIRRESVTERLRVMD